jgi:hypothetical protein
MSGPLGASQYMYSAGAGEFYSHLIEQSARFDGADSSINGTSSLNISNTAPSAPTLSYPPNNTLTSNSTVFLNWSAVIDTVDTVTDPDYNGSNNPGLDGDEYYYFDTSFELKDNDKIEIYVDVKKEAEADDYLKFKIDNTNDATNNDGTTKSFIDIEYVADGNSVDDTSDVGGTAESNKLTIRSASK